MDFWDFEDNQGAPKDPKNQIWAPCSPTVHQACWQHWHSFWSSGAFFSTWLYGWLYKKSLWFGVKNMVQHKTLNSGCWHLPPRFFWILLDQNLAHVRLAGKSLWTQRSRLFVGGVVFGADIMAEVLQEMLWRLVDVTGVWTDWISRSTGRQDSLFVVFLGDWKMELEWIGHIPHTHSEVSHKQNARSRSVQSASCSPRRNAPQLQGLSTSLTSGVSWIQRKCEDLEGMELHLFGCRRPQRPKNRLSRVWKLWRLWTEYRSTWCGVLCVLWFSVELPVLRKITHKNCRREGVVWSDWGSAREACPRDLCQVTCLRSMSI